MDEEFDLQAFLKKRFAKSESVVYRKISGESILVPICRRVEDVDCIYTLNEVASRIWELVDSTRNLNDIGNFIVEEFDVSRQTVEADLSELIQKLVALGALTEA